MNEAKAQRQRITTPLSGGGSVTRSLTGTGPALIRQHIKHNHPSAVDFTHIYRTGIA